MQNKGPYYITTAIAYTSGKPHIGNTYEIIMADSIAVNVRIIKIIAVILLLLIVFMAKNLLS